MFYLMTALFFWEGEDGLCLCNPLLLHLFHEYEIYCEH